jgi:hypothetical protein
MCDPRSASDGLQNTKRHFPTQHFLLPTVHSTPRHQSHLDPLASPGKFERLAEIP